MDVGNATFGQGFLEHSVETPLNASDLFAVGIYGQISNPRKTASYAMTVKVLKTELEDDIGLHLKDDGLAGTGIYSWILSITNSKWNSKLVPDITISDDLYSQYFYDLFHPGFYFTQYHLTIPDQPGIHFYWPGPSFYLTDVISNPRGEDRIPPSRIMDLRANILTETINGGKVNLKWTAPGDNLNYGTGNNKL